MVLLPVALKLNKPFAVVRNKNSHSDLRVEGDDRARDYVIIDDLIQSGKTGRKVIKEMRLWNDSEPIGIVLYHRQGESRAGQGKLRYESEEWQPRDGSEFGNVLRGKVKIVSLLNGRF
jgi:orotate phosphoribosyltransferase